MSEEEEYLRSLSPDRLLMVPFDKYRWSCCIDDCENGTAIKDFGIAPVYHWRKKFLDLGVFVFMCGKHRKFKLTPSGTYAKHKEGEVFLKLKEGSGINHLTKI